MRALILTMRLTLAAIGVYLLIHIAALMAYGPGIEARVP